MKINDIRLTEHFKLREFECRCCNVVMLDPALVERLQTLRTLWQKPIHITSGYRCTPHNQAVGGKQQSRHRLGRAADVKVTEPEQAKFEALARKCGFAKVILYGKRGFVHVEV